MSATPQSAVVAGEIWPALVDVYHEQGFEDGYRRGVNDVLAAVLETTEDFARKRGGDVTQTRKLLHEFARHLEEFVARTGRGGRDHVYFQDGSGI